MSVEKSTIDRILWDRRRALTPTSRPHRADRHAVDGAAVDRPPLDEAVGGLPSSAALRRTFDILERRHPALGGLLAERLWFRLPAGPDGSVREQRTPAGGVPFEVPWTGGAAAGVVRGRVYGDWGNPTAYLVHGWGGWWQQLSAHVHPLLDAGLCVVAFDAPSHGDSTPGGFGRRSTTFVEMAHALAAVVAEFGRPTVVVAHSAGALAALHARGLGVTPDAYTLLAPPLSVEPMVQVFAAALGVGPRSREVMVRRAGQRVGLPMDSLDLVTMASQAPSLPPLLVVHDRADREAPLAGAVALKDAWHDARLVVTNGLGHRRLMWDRAVVAGVTAFAAAAADRVRRSSR
jgi:pimeloyl-ACP methyl ester carboxylesterase